MSDWPTRVEAVLRPLADHQRAEGMRAYMKGIAPFLGIAAPDRRRATKPVPLPPDVELADDCRRLFALPEREFHYVAVEALAARAKKQPPAFLDELERFVRAGRWWDTVDVLVRGVGDLVRRYPELAPRMDEWVHDDDRWVARVAILHQLGARGATDTDRLARLCLARASDTEFFLRKAIGWALRDYAWTDPAWVRAFVDEHRDQLSGLSAREATKNLDHPLAGSRR